MKYLAALLIAIALPLSAQEFIASNGPLTDDDFYNTVACGARPGGECQAPYVRWVRQNGKAITVAFQPVPATYPARLERALSFSLDRAIQQLNNATGTIQLRRTYKSGNADISIYLQNIVAGDDITGIGVHELEGVPIGAAIVQVWWNNGLEITEAVIVFASDIPLDEADSIMLEELTQGLGLLTDIRNPFYNDRSIFSEDSNSVRKLGPQDRMAIARHYSNSN